MLALDLLILHELLPLEEVFKYLILINKILEVRSHEVRRVLYHLLRSLIGSVLSLRQQSRRFLAFSRRGLVPLLSSLLVSFRSL